MRLRHNLMVVGLLGALAGCGSDDPAVGSGGVPGGGAGGTGATGGMGGPGGTTSGGATFGGTTAGGSVSGTAGGAAGGTTGGNSCEARNISTRGLAPDMLIVMDRSLSTLGLFPPTGVDRWTPSKMAIKTITQDFQGVMDFGLMLFPGGSGLHPLECSAGKVDVPIAENNAAPIASTLDMSTPNGQTPTGVSLQEALKALGNRTPMVDAEVKPGFVLLVTDGQPSCLAGSADAAQEQAARDAVSALRAANIPTYVLGYQIEPAYQGLMNELAMLGGTGTYKPVESADSITAAFREITKDVIKCEFELSEVPPDPSYVRVTLDGTTLPLNSADGWIIEGKKVTLQGAACTTLKDGRGHILNATVECQVVTLE